MPWVAKLDDEGPRNGDVIVRTDKGRLVAVIYAAASETETMRRANALLAADPANLCSWCQGDLACGELCACNTVCTVCGGDCAGANPPVTDCPNKRMSDKAAA